MTKHTMTSEAIIHLRLIDRYGWTAPGFMPEPVREFLIGLGFATFQAVDGFWYIAITTAGRDALVDLDH